MGVTAPQGSSFSLIGSTVIQVTCEDLLNDLADAVSKECCPSLSGSAKEARRLLDSFGRMDAETSKIDARVKAALEMLLVETDRVKDIVDSMERAHGLREAQDTRGSQRVLEGMGERSLNNGFAMHGARLCELRRELEGFDASIAAERDGVPFGVHKGKMGPKLDRACRFMRADCDGRQLKAARLQIGVQALISACEDIHSKIADVGSRGGSVVDVAEAIHQAGVHRAVGQMRERIARTLNVKEYRKHGGG